jgi:LmbE family N-acetylglucosaminyl deacetylase
MRWIYLSPHLDDAVLSAGGLIYEQARAGVPVEIWTLMCGYAPEDAVSPFAQMLHQVWGASSAEEATRLRRHEDKCAAAILGAGVVHFDFLDCIYRRGASGEWLYSEVFAPPHPEDAQLPSWIAEILLAHLDPEDVLVCQLALGSHVDHVLVRQGAELLGRALFYDIDVPYVFYHAEKLEEKTAGMKESVHFVTETGLKRWQEAALEYKSQIPTLREAFDTPERVRESLRSYRAGQGGIHLLQMSDRA